MKPKDIVVSISCITYNHAPYIRQCLDGFLMQQTDFAFEVLIHDDCSTDGTTEIIKEYEAKYPDIIKPMYEEENQYQQGKPSGSAVWNFPRAKGKYIALCEGDDYWIDPLKLQKQVDVMENDSTIAMVYTKAKLYNQSKERFAGEMGESTTFEDLLCNFNNAIPTASVIFRNKCYKEYLSEIKPQQHKWKMGDYPFNLYVLMKYKAFMINDLSVVYRIVENSASHNRNEVKLIPYYKSIFDIKKHYFELTLGNDDLRRKMCHHYLGFAYKLYCRLPNIEIQKLVDYVYWFMSKETFFEKLIYNLIVKTKGIRQLKQVAVFLYSRIY